MNAVTGTIIPFDTVFQLNSEFDDVDSNRDGFITKAELKANLIRKGVKVSDRELDATFNDADTNKDGKLSWDEILKKALKGCHSFKEGNWKEREKHPERYVDVTGGWEYISEEYYD